MSAEQLSVAAAQIVREVIAAQPAAAPRIAEALAGCLGANWYTPEAQRLLAWLRSLGGEP